MKLIFLGTGTSQGVPMIGSKSPVSRSTDPRDNRLRTSAAIVTDNGHIILLDCGPDFRYQMLRAGLSDLDGILFIDKISRLRRTLYDSKVKKWLKRKNAG